MKNKIKSFDEFINENYQTDPLYDIAAEVYDMIDYRDLENKTKVRSALKKLGYGTDPITVGRVMRKIQQVINESYEKASSGDYLEKFNRKGELVLTAERFESGNWIVHEYPSYRGKSISGEYTDDEFKKIKKYF